jgi:hypothetical protein
MTKEDAAAALNGNEYRREGSKELFAAMKADGLVAVFGASDDLLEFRGAIYDEVGAYEGTTVKVDAEGLIPTWDSLEDASESEHAAYFRRKPNGVAIEAVWAPGDPDASWLIITDIPHATFDIMEEGDLYCRGIVFALSDLPA